MPSIQRGALTKRGDRWTVRYRDEQGQQRRQTFGPGREGKADASEWLERKLREVEALRRGDVVAHRRRQLPTLSELVSEYIDQQSTEANTISYAQEAAALCDRGTQAGRTGRIQRPPHRPPDRPRDRGMAQAAA